MDRVEYVIRFAGGLNHARSEYPLEEGYHYYYRMWGRGQWGPWVPSRTAYAREEEAIAAAEALGYHPLDEA